jgi:hypothetical protein
MYLYKISYYNMNVRKPKILEAYKPGWGLLIEQDAGYIDPNNQQNKVLIREFEESFSTEQIKEPLVVIVVLQKYGIKNKNGRIYPKDVLVSQSEEYQKIIDMHASTGELNHPESSIIDGERISHWIRKTWWDGNTLMGEMEILMSPGYLKTGVISCMGDHVANLLRKGIRIGVSSRGVGTLETVGGNLVVQDDFELVCWDIVTNPSTPGSYIFTSKEDYQANKMLENTEKTSLLEALDDFLVI